MKKLILSFALIALVAAGCNKAANNNNQNQGENQTQDQGGAAGTQQTSNENPNSDVTSSDTNNSNQNPVDNNGSEQENTPQVFAVKMTANGFSPSTITISKGDYIQFVNEDTAAHWPASDPHPTHTGLAGFDAKAGVQTGKYFRFEFNTVGTFTYHDHLNSSLKGTIIVK